MPKIIRITTTPLSLKYLLAGQMRYMKANGFEVIMVSSDGKEREEVIRNENCRYQLIPMTRQISPVADLISLWRLYRFFKKEKPDIVHSHTPKAGLLAMLAAKLSGVKIRIHTVAGLRFMTTSGNTRRLLMSMEKLTLKAATHVWPNSLSLKDYILKKKLTSASKTDVIGLGSSNGINLSRFSSTALDPKRMAEIKQSINFEEKNIYFLSVGRIVRDKGINELLEVFTEIYRKDSCVRLILVGSLEHDLDPISTNALDILKKHPGVIEAGWNDAVEYFMAFSFALVHPSHREGFPNVLLQAGAMHCPVICSRIEGCVDIVDDGQTGLMFKVKNPTELKQKLEQALTDKNAMKIYADNLLEKIRNNFDQQVVHRLLKLKYDELLHRYQNQ